MRIVIISHIVACFLIFFNYQEAAAQPGSGINPADYQFSMNITGVYVSDCVFSGNQENRISAFVGDELRGTATFSVAYNDQALAFLTVFSNKASGEVLRFELYDTGLDKVISLPVKLSFVENGIHGSVQAPFQFYDDAPVQTGYLEETAPGILQYSQEVPAAVYTWYKNGDLQGKSADSRLYICETGWYRVEVQAGTCSILKDSLFYVGKENEISVKKKLEGQKLIHLLNIDGCEESFNVYTYELVLGEGSTDNYLFGLRGDTLVMLSGIGIDRLNYTIRVKATDRFGNTVEQAIRMEYIAAGMAERIAGDVRLYPNPFEGGSLFISLPGEYDREIMVRIVTMNGTSGNVWQRLTKGVNELQGADDLPAGVYLLELQTGEIAVYKKLMKK